MIQVFNSFSLLALLLLKRAFIQHVSILNLRVMFFQHANGLHNSCDIGTSTVPIFRDKDIFTHHPPSYAIR